MTDGRVDDGNKGGAPPLRLLVLQTLGVVYGDIATSPLYAFRTCFSGHLVADPSPEHVLGILSLITWSLLLLISVKYAMVVLRADLRGEGGILALMTLVTADGLRRASGPALTALGLFGAALLYGDGMITPAMSVLSAMEGIRVAAPHFESAVVPLTLVILVALFLVQRHGSAIMGNFFGPVMVLWFACITVLGTWSLWQTPRVLAALNPAWGVRFLLESPRTGFLALGAVFLAVTGAEAMYADLGHFGRRPIRIAWFTLVLPALLLNYFGQGALVLRRPETASHSFYYLAPEWALFPLIGLAAAATVVASQAIITGAFSLTYQAVQLGLLPRFDIRHYSPEGEGKVYIPFVNQALLVAAVVLVLAFRSSDNLAAAYGVAVSGTMVMTSILLFFCFRHVWHWRWISAAALAASFLAVELVFLAANLVKVPQGGWFPLLIGLVLYVVMQTWKRGRALVETRMGENRLELLEDVGKLLAQAPKRVDGTAIYISRSPQGLPLILLRNLTHNKILHEQILLLAIQTDEVPRVPTTGRIQIDRLDGGFLRVIAHYGFMQTPNVPVLLRELKTAGVQCDAEHVTFFAARDRYFITGTPEMARWRKHLFAFLARNSPSAVLQYRVPAEQLFEIGLLVLL